MSPGSLYKMQRLINFGLLVSSLFCYLEWADRSAFLFQVEYGLFFKATQTIESLVHPLILIPLLGQLILLFALIKRQQNFKLTFIGMTLLSLLVLVIFLAGILSMNVKIIVSTVPFILLSIFTLYQNRRSKQPG